MHDYQITDVTGGLHYIRISLDDGTDVIAEGDFRTNGFTACKNSCKRIKGGARPHSSPVCELSSADIECLVVNARKFLTNKRFSLEWVDS